MKTLLIAAVSLLFLFAIVLTSSSQLQNVKLKILKPGEVNGMGVVVDGKEYTLNFSQQNALIEELNNLRPAQEAEGKPQFFEKVIIYRFNEPVWTLTALKTGAENIYVLHSKNNEVFLSSEGNSIHSILKDASTR